MRAWFSPMPRSLWLGLCYGAVCGTLFGGVWFLLAWRGEVSLGLSPIGLLALAASFGGILGGLTGLLFGFIGGGCRRPFGWGMAGLLTGTLAASSLFGQVWALFPPIIAAAVGVAIGLGLKSGRSRLPGVTRFAAAVREADEREASRRSGGPAEVAPADAPAGRGDEAIPTS